MGYVPAPVAEAKRSQSKSSFRGDETPITSCKHTRSRRRGKENMGAGTLVVVVDASASYIKSYNILDSVLSLGAAGMLIEEDIDSSAALRLHAQEWRAGLVCVEQRGCL